MAENVEVRVEGIAKQCGVTLRAASKDIKLDAKGAVLKTINFKLPEFEEDPIGADDKPISKSLEDKLDSAILFYGELVKDEKGAVGVLTMLADASYGRGLKIRSAIDVREKLALKGPEDEIEKEAKKLASFRGITLDDARERVKIAWGV